MLRKYYLLGLISFLVAGQVCMAALNFDMRVDMDSANYSESYTGKNDYSAFIVHTGRVDWQGKLLDDLSFRFRPRFDTARNTTDGIDKLTMGIDLAYIQHKMGSLNLTAGKLMTDVAIHENLMSSVDVYLRTEALNAISSGYKLLSNTSLNAVYPVKYMTGAKLAWSDEKNELAVLGVNNPEFDQADASASEVGGNKRLLYGVVYKGKFCDKSIQPVASFHTTKLGGDTAKAETDNAEVKYYAAGLKYDVTKYFATLDWGRVDVMNINDGGVGVDSTIDSLSIEGGYRFEQWTARLKLEQSKVEAMPTGSGSVNQDIFGYAAAVEYRPFLGKNFRYHLVYSQKELQQSGVDDKTETHIIAGFHILADFLQ